LREVPHGSSLADQVPLPTEIFRLHSSSPPADERVAGLLHDLIDADETFLTLDPSRKIREDEYEPDPAALSLGTTTDWGALAGAWLTEWERGGDETAKMKLLNGARTIAALPNGWAQGDARYNMEDGSYLPQTEPSVSIGH